VNYDIGYDFSAAIGYAPATQRGFLYHTRFSVEGAYRTNPLNKVAGALVTHGYLQAASLMANAYYDLHNSSQVTPYFGGGLGIANINLTRSVELGFAEDESDIVPAFQLMTGISFAPNPNSASAVHLGYRYFGSLDDVELQLNDSQKLKADYRSHIIEGGIRVDF
jgi:opacity protein-like surface antigen